MIFQHLRPTQRCLFGNTSCGATWSLNFQSRVDNVDTPKWIGQTYMEVSWNGGIPKSSILDWDFPLLSSRILGVPRFMESLILNMLQPLLSRGQYFGGPLVGPENRPLWDGSIHVDSHWLKVAIGGQHHLSQWHAQDCPGSKSMCYPLVI